MSLWDSLYLSNSNDSQETCESDRGRVSHVPVKSPPARLLALCLFVMNFKRFGFHLDAGWEQFLNLRNLLMTGV